jgi:hypothetical protein
MTTSRRLLTDYPIGKAIIDGEHDAELHIIEQAIKHRRRLMERATGATAGSRFRGGRGREGGKEGTILKVNPKRFHIHYDGDPEWVNFAAPKAMLEILPATDESIAEARAFAALPKPSKWDD